MIKLDNLDMIGEYVLVQPSQTQDSAIIMRSHDEDKMLMGTVLSVENTEEEDILHTEDGSYEVTIVDTSPYYAGDMILFNRAKSLPVPREPQEDEVFIVRRDDVFGTYNLQTEEA